VLRVQLERLVQQGQLARRDQAGHREPQELPVQQDPQVLRVLRVLRVQVEQVVLRELQVQQDQVGRVDLKE